MCLEGLHKEIKAGCRKTEAGSGHVPLLGSVGSMFWGSPDKAGWVSANHNEWSSGKPRGGLI